MLIHSPRFKRGDLQHWQLLEDTYDGVFGEAVEATRVPQALNVITQWADSVPSPVCSVSWGKDSVVVADLLTRAGINIPIVWVRSDPWEMPECEQVRDTFLASHPQVTYQERVATLRNPKRGEPGYEAHHLNPHSKGQDVLKELITEPYMSGVRAQESRMRANSARWHGLATGHTCRPILHWAAEEVFGYLHVNALPVHPAYGMTYGGRLDRRWIRVHPLCSYHERSGTHDDDREQWEDDYWPDVTCGGGGGAAYPHD